MQIGAELYGHSGLEADIEIVGLLASALSLCDIQTVRLDFGHAAIFNALVERCRPSCRAQAGGIQCAAG
jgi:ATP phosphoribosyltransferase regulatory subunit